MSKERDYIEFLKDIIKFMEKAENFVLNMSYEEFIEDEKTIFSVIRALEVVGEAIKHIPSNIRGQFPEIPWRIIAGMRDILAHDYFIVDLETLWETIQKNIPDVKPLLKGTLIKLKETEDQTQDE